MVSLVIPLYNSQITIIDTLNSIKQQTVIPQEIIIVNDCSTDNSIIVIKDFQNKNPDINIKLVTNSKRLGPGLSRNKGCDVSNHEYIFFLDSDVILKKNAIEQFINYIKKYDSVVGIYTKKYNEKSILSFVKAYYYYEMNNINNPIKTSIFHAAICGIKKSIFDELGGYNKFFSYSIDFENEELGYRISQKYNQYLCPAIQGDHQWPGNFKIFKTMIKRTSYFIEYYLSNLSTTKSEKVILTKYEAFKIFLSLSFIFSIFLNITINNFFLIPLLIIILLIIKYNKNYLNLCKNDGHNFLKCFFLLILFHNIIGFGICFGITKFLSRTGKLTNFFKRQK